MENCTEVQSAPDICAELEERLRFETLLTEISARFVNLRADHVFSRIDAASQPHAIEKIKTIGDCYIGGAVCSGRDRTTPARWPKAEEGVRTQASAGVEA